MNNGGKTLLLAGGLVLLVVGIFCLRHRVGPVDAPPAFVPGDGNAGGGAGGGSNAPTVLSTDPSSESMGGSGSPWGDSVPSELLNPLQTPTYPVNTTTPPAWPPGERANDADLRSSSFDPPRADRNRADSGEFHAPALEASGNWPVARVPLAPPVLLNGRTLAEPVPHGEAGKPVTGGAPDGTSIAPPMFDAPSPVAQGDAALTQPNAPVTASFSSPMQTEMPALQVASHLGAPPELPPSTTAITRDNDSLWTISERLYGNGLYYRALFALNRERLPHPDRIMGGIELTTPPVAELKQLFPELCP